MASSLNSNPSGSSAGRVPGQVCDRCRRRKIKCHGQDNDCSACRSAGVICVTSATLKRNRKRKSFYESEGIEQRRDSPARTSNDESPPQHILRSIVDLPITPGPSNAVQTLPGIPFPRAPSTLETDTGSSATTGLAIAAQSTDPVIGHMGRMVQDDRQAAMFGGSTTGVHFISQAEQHVQLLQLHKDAFPSCAYSLYLHNLWGAARQGVQQDMVYEIVSQLPPDTMDILEATIDRWTPLYPIVHKPSILQAVQKLLLFDEPDSDRIVTLYQTLSLLALGTIGLAGDCMQPHHHFLCLSERYYSISSTLLDKVIDQPCLQSLQGLVITQIYLQLSCRYSIASHIGGVATRLAQTLGLHRHSHRFKFDPLESELRRRGWWCQYSLDTFSSAYHGMPRLIRDQDVDTDLPTSVDHDLLSRTHVAFPLPGERSQVDTAISLFKLARVFGRTLEELYTTTKRRGGVAKIEHLQAELDTWARENPSMILMDDASGIDVNVLMSNASMEAIFLSVAHCVATIHVHRPALSFTTTDPHFITSLRMCGRASAHLIKLLSIGLSSDDVLSITPQASARWTSTLLVTLLYPCGVHMLWQAGVTVVFAGLKGYPVTADQDEELINACVSTLRRLHNLFDDKGNHVQQCADVLDLLREKTFSGTETLPVLDQLQWNLWDWPMESALELANTLDAAPNLDLSLEPERWL